MITVRLVAEAVGEVPAEADTVHGAAEASVEAVSEVAVSEAEVPPRDGSPCRNHGITE